MTSPTATPTSFYPEATLERGTLALVVDIDPMKIAGRGNNRQLPREALQDYVNDRPYAATSHLTSAMMDLFSTAISGRCNDRPELPETVMPLVATVASLPCRRNDELIHRFFGPLGYQITAEPVPLDEQFPEWGMSRFYNLTLRAETTVQLLLKHLCTLIPVLDNAKHYGTNEDEVKKLMRLATGWIEDHPERDIIMRRYLRHRYRLGPVHTNGAEMLSSPHGDYSSSVRTHCTGPSRSARERQTVELASAQRDSVCRRAGLQVAGVAGPIRQLAYRLHTDEPLVEEWSDRPGV